MIELDKNNPLFSSNMAPVEAISEPAQTSL